MPDISIILPGQIAIERQSISPELMILDPKEWSRNDFIPFLADIDGFPEGILVSHSMQN